MVQLGVVFPNEIGADSGAVRAFAQAAEDLGYQHLLIFDHVLGADSRVRPGWKGAYDHTSLFHEPFVVFGFLAAVTQRIQLATGVLVLPQRQTALVAKQAAEVDILSGGRLRLGIGLGWNDVEYEALGEDFHTRGARSEEQIALMRALWTQEVVTFEGKWHKVTAAGINPLPIQKPIPIWLGGLADPVLRRIARIGDGFIATAFVRPTARSMETLNTLRRYVREAGRDPASVGIDVRTNLTAGGIEQAVVDAEKWRRAGITHLTFNTLNAGLTGPDQHIDAIRRFKSSLPKEA